MACKDHLSYTGSCKACLSIQIQTQEKVLFAWAERWYRLEESAQKGLKEKMRKIEYEIPLTKAEEKS